MSVVTHRDLYLLHNNLDKVGGTVESLDLKLDMLTKLVTAILAALNGDVSQLAKCPPADVAIVEATMGTLLPKAEFDSRASPVGPFMVEDDTRLPPTLASGPFPRRDVLGDWARQSASVKTAPLDRPKSPPPTRPRRADTVLAKIMVQQTKPKEHKLLLKPAEEGFDGLSPAHLQVFRRGSSFGVIASDHPLPEREGVVERKKGHVEERLSSREYWRSLGMRTKKRSSRQAARPTKKVSLKAGVKPPRPQKVEKTITDERRELIRRARAVGLASRNFNPAAVRAAAVAVAKFWSKILRPSRGQARPLVSAFAAPLGEALAKFYFSKAEATGKHTPIEPTAKNEKEEVVVAALGGAEEEGGAVEVKLQVSVLQLKARIEAGGQTAAAPTKTEVCEVANVVKGRVSDRIKFYEGEGRLTREQIRGRADMVEERGCLMIHHNIIINNVGSPKAKPLAELPRPMSSVTDDCIEGGEAQLTAHAG